MEAQVLTEVKEKSGKTVQNTSREMAVIRTGKASPALLDNIRVECWGDTMPIKQVAGISAPEPRLIVVQPWDPSTAAAIARAIESSDLGLRAAVEGPVIRIPIPKLSEERRKDLIRLVRKLAEEGRTALRNVRRDANDQLRKACKAGEITEDTEKKTQDLVQKTVDEAVSEIDNLLKAKEKEILEV